ncbi:MAG: alpha-glucan family phosphorylase [Pseudomonadales bacterium]
MVSHLLSVEHPEHLRPIIERLTTLATDLHWTWNHGGDAFWRSIDANVWERTRNPFVVLQNLSIGKLGRLYDDAEFRRELDRLNQALEAYETRPRWGDEVFPNSHASEAPADGSNVPPQVAYFSMEFGLGVALPMYAGGLGILAGDHLKAASDLGIPLVGVSLMYHEGYFRQTFDPAGRQQEIFAHIDSRNVPVRPLSLLGDGWQRITIDFPGRTVYLRVWEARVGRVRLFLLDSNDPLNNPSDQGITSRLYGGTTEERLMQAIVLGIGGWRLIEALPEPIRVLHLNEGHAAFATLERARCCMEREQISFWEALWATRAGNVFTTHTPLPAAFDVYPIDLLAKYSSAYAPELHLSASELNALGRARGDADAGFNMAYLAMRTCARANGVSELHGRVSRHIFRNLFERWPESEVPVRHVTNGVHVPSWDSPWSDEIWTEACGKDRWLGVETDLGAAMAHVDNETLWDACGRERADLVGYVRGRLVRQLAMQGAGEDQLRCAAAALDPNVLTLGFARRFTAYKRPNLLLSDPQRLARILTDRTRPAQLIIAGKAHPEDGNGKLLLQRWIEFANRDDVRGHVVFLYDYDIPLAQELVQGVDVWLNTPRRPWEACGTSGMKVQINGGLNLSTLDGWWAEAHQPDYGWAIGADPGSDIERDFHAGAAAGHGDEEDAATLYRLLEESVIPEFYHRDEHGIPQAWVNRIRKTMVDLVPKFSANRMMRQYTQSYYLPALQDFGRRISQGAARARQQAAWWSRLNAHWPNIHWGSLSFTPDDGSIQVALQVYLGDIRPDDVCVQLYADPLPDQPRHCQAMSRCEPIAGAQNSFCYRLTLSSERPLEHFTPRVIANPEHAQTPMEAPFISWWHR